MNMNTNLLHRKSILAGLSVPALLLSTALSAGTGTDPSASGWQGATHDAWIDGKIEASFTLNRYLNPFEIDTQVENGRVLLTGTVESQIDKDLAGEIAEGVDGVTEVTNKLEVVPDTQTAANNGSRDFGDYVSDATLTAKVKYALIENDSTDGLSIDVDTENAKVTLHGDVDSAQVKELAGRIARNVEGVASVDNQLKVGNQS